MSRWYLRDEPLPGHVEYCGRDGRWSEDRDGCPPFLSLKDAHTAKAEHEHRCQLDDCGATVVRVGPKPVSKPKRARKEARR